MTGVKVWSGPWVTPQCPNPLKCAAGKYSKQPELGEYSGLDGPGSKACQPCDAGKYSKEGGDAFGQCSKCEAGRFSATTGASTCSGTCDAGKYSKEGSSECSKCEAGKFSGTSASVCTACEFGHFSDSSASVCSKCEAPAGHACTEGSASKEGVKCPSHLSCPGGASGASPTMVIIVGLIAALALCFSFYVVYAMSQRRAKCGGCGVDLSCSKTLIQIANVRVVALFVAVTFWPLLSVFAGLAIRFFNGSLRGGMIAIVVLASFVARAMITIGVFASLVALTALCGMTQTGMEAGLWKWMNQSVCCLCQQRSKPNQVHIDMEE